MLTAPRHLAALIVLCGVPRVAEAAGECPADQAGTSDPPAALVQVVVESVRPNSDMEGDDDFVPFYNNRADLYGTVTVGDNTYELPIVTESDHPFWGDLDDAFVADMSNGSVPISIEIFESDSGLTGDDDVMDVSPDPAKTRLDLVYEPCAGTVSGDIPEQRAGSVIPIKSGTGDDQGTIELRVFPSDGRPPTKDDVAITGFDLIQVVPHSTRMVASKGTVAMVRLANNADIDVPATIDLRIVSSTILVDEVFTVDPPLAPGEVRTMYLGANDPFEFPGTDVPYEITAVATLDTGGLVGASYGPADCRAANDSSGRNEWSVVTTPRLKLLWVQTGTLIDLPDLASDQDVETFKERNAPFIAGTFPTPGTANTMGQFPLIPPVTAALSWLTTVLAAFGIPADCLEPGALMLELDSAAFLLGADFLVGVLPPKYFHKFSSTCDTKDVLGMSNGEMAPRGIIMVPRVGPNFPTTTTAHEIGHGIGLSVDPSLQDSWVCQVDWPLLSTSPCLMVGGFEEARTPPSDGNPTWGYWVANGTEPPELQPLADQPQCDSNCFMGNASTAAHANWANDGSWIDRPDYQHSLDRFSDPGGALGLPGPDILYMQGMIAENDTAFLGDWYIAHDQAVDRDESSTEGMYTFRFLDTKGQQLQQISMPLHWADTHGKMGIPVTFFAQRVPLPANTRTVELVNELTKATLATKELSRHAPEVQIVAPKGAVTVKEKATVEWKAYDKDQDPLRFTVLMAERGSDDWFPVVHKYEDTALTIDASDVDPGQYELKVIATDGTHATHSEPIHLAMGTKLELDDDLDLDSAWAETSDDEDMALDDEDFDDAHGCACASTRNAGAGALLLLVMLGLARRRDRKSLRG